MNTYKSQLLCSIVIAMATFGCSGTESEKQTQSPSNSQVKQTETGSSSLAMSDSSDEGGASTYVGACVEAVGSVFTRTNEEGFQETCTVQSQVFVNGHCQQNLYCVNIASDDDPYNFNASQLGGFDSPNADYRSLFSSQRVGGTPLSGPLNTFSE
jgi:hypothetical protein